MAEAWDEAAEPAEIGQHVEWCLVSQLVAKGECPRVVIHIHPCALREYDVALRSVLHHRSHENVVAEEILVVAVDESRVIHHVVEHDGAHQWHAIVVSLVADVAVDVGQIAVVEVDVTAHLVYHVGIALVSRLGHGGTVCTNVWREGGKLHPAEIKLRVGGIVVKCHEAAHVARQQRYA